MPEDHPSIQFSEQDKSRFHTKVQKWSGCWLWTGCTKGKGYGTFIVRRYGRSVFLRAHRVAWEIARGPIPHGLTIDHLCRNRACVNPDHLEPVEGRVNTLRGVGITAICSRKTHCKQGHPLIPGNLANGKRGRACLICTRASAKASARKKRASTNGKA